MSPGGPAHRTRSSGKCWPAASCRPPRWCAPASGASTRSPGWIFRRSNARRTQTAGCRRAARHRAGRRPTRSSQRCSQQRVYPAVAACGCDRRAARQDRFRFTNSIFPLSVSIVPVMRSPAIVTSHFANAAVRPVRGWCRQSQLVSRHRPVCRHHVRLDGANHPRDCRAVLAQDRESRHLAFGHRDRDRPRARHVDLCPSATCQAAAQSMTPKPIARNMVRPPYQANTQLGEEGFGSIVTGDSSGPKVTVEGQRACRGSPSGLCRPIPIHEQMRAGCLATGLAFVMLVLIGGQRAARVPRRQARPSSSHVKPLIGPARRFRSRFRRPDGDAKARPAAGSRAPAS